MFTIIKTQIFQPTVPPYRVPLFDELTRFPDLDVRLCASPASTATGFSPNLDLKGRINIELRMHGMFGNRLFWQAPARVDPDLGLGDVIVISGNPRFLSNFPLIIQARRRGIGIVWWGHGWTAGASELNARIRRAIMRLADVWLLYSDKEVEEYQQLGFEPERLHATNNTIDHRVMDRLRSGWTVEQSYAFKAGEGLEHTRLLLFCGRLTPKARLDLALLAMRELVDDGLDVVLVVIGDGPMREEWRQLAGRLGLSARVRWLGLLYDEVRLAPWFLAAEAFVYPGAIGLSLNHALAYGLPVITHDNARNQMPEFAALSPGNNGMTYKEGDWKDLAWKIRSLLSNPELRARMSEEALRTLHRDYSFDGMVNRFAVAIRKASSIARNRANRNR